MKKFSAAIVFLLGLYQVQADLLVYDPFLSGGATPNAAAGEYQTGTVYPDDHIINQAPTVQGFAATPWTSASAYADFVYYRNEDAQMGYTDSAGRMLDTQQGQLNHFRASGGSADIKNMSRDLAIGNSLNNVMYISLTLQISAGSSFTFRSASTDGNSSRRFNFGINENGNPFTNGTLNGAGAPGTQHINSNLTVNATQNHFLVARLTNTGVTNDEIALYIDPRLENESLNTIASEVTVGNFYVGGNAAWTLQDAFFQNVVPIPGMAITIDELRIGTTWADVTPHQIPEPRSSGLLVLGFALLLRRLNRKHP